MNVMSDEDQALSDGDAWQCEYCRTVFSIDEGTFHCCPEMQAAHRGEAERAHKHFFGNGHMVRRRLVIDIVCPATQPAFLDALNTATSMYPDQTAGADDILQFSWQITEL